MIATLPSVTPNFSSPAVKKKTVPTSAPATQPTTNKTATMYSPPKATFPVSGKRGPIGRIEPPSYEAKNKPAIVPSQPPPVTSMPSIPPPSIAKPAIIPQQQQPKVVAPAVQPMRQQRTVIPRQQQAPAFDQAAFMQDLLAQLQAQQTPQAVVQQDPQVAALLQNILQNQAWGNVQNQAYQQANWLQNLNAQFLNNLQQGSQYNPYIRNLFQRGY